MNRILITGANGFVGSHALASLVEAPDKQVIAACRDHNKLLKSFSGEVREGDIRDEAYLETLFDGIDTLVIAAAWSAAWGHRKESHRYFLQPTLRLIEKACQAGVTKIINVSSTSAAAPDQSVDPMSKGIKRGLWPHLDNVIEIEDRLRSISSENLTVINLRFGIYVGQRYGLGILPILLPRLKTHLVPWVSGGETRIPFVDGVDIGQAITCACMEQHLTGYQGFNVVGPRQPRFKEFVEFIHSEFAYPKPHFNVPFAVAYPFARLMETIDPLVPWEPLVTRSIIHLLEETNADNTRAEAMLGYKAKVDWQTSVRQQINDMHTGQRQAMPMAKPIVD